MQHYPLSSLCTAIIFLEGCEWLVLATVLWVGRWPGSGSHVLFFLKLLNDTYPSLQGSTKACLGAHRILNDYQQAGNMLGLVHMCFALMVVLIEDGFCMFACCRNCVIPKTACLVVGWLWTKLKWGSVKSPNVSIIVAIWISIPWGIWRVSSLHAAPLCVRREFLLVVKDCVWRFSSQDSGYI